MKGINLRYPLLFTFVTTATMAHFSHAEHAQNCDRIAVAAERACFSDSHDDYWITYGNCLNTGNAHAMRDCVKDALAQKSADRTLCSEQRDARSDVCEALGQAPYLPGINPQEFLSPAQIAAAPNAYFPLLPGLVRVYEGGGETVTVTVTGDTVEILGITCIVVHDVVTRNGVLFEDTHDWFAQDIHGNVWYFGEIVHNYDHGQLVNVEGTWRADDNGAHPGIVMHAAPTVGTVFRQEYLLGEAEDMGEILSVSNTTASTPAANCASGCVVVRDYTPISPDAQELKYYAPGIGNILVTDPDTGEVEEQLVKVVYPTL
jgi:hypothetical protein